MCKICIIMGGVMPVPAVCGGAIEILIASIAKQYSAKDGFALTICSVYHPEARYERRTCRHRHADSPDGSLSSTMSGQPHGDIIQNRRLG